ncbi:MAG: biotin--[acetyl-CoA-carboxylase] ligase [Desulfovibrionaceae bacterium]|nr:biotin--[acetyl-CoA-carboxylase] ligase [Desulfovibrionaceae bacterium]
MTDTVCHKPMLEESPYRWKAPVIWRFVTVDSCLDTAFRLAAAGRLRVWDSVQVCRQTAGRGQLRRQWHSPHGNIYAALRLPLAPPFDGTAAASVTGFLLAGALSQLGWPVLLKWPNDLVLSAPDGARKVAGILLEERGGILLAGIGINVFSSPSDTQMRSDAALPATCLARYGEGQPFLPEMLWQELVKRAFSAYALDCFNMEQWQARFLLWRGREVVLRDAGQVVHGRLEGLAPNGAVRLLCASGCEEWLSGSLSLSESSY